MSSSTSESTENERQTSDPKDNSTTTATVNSSVTAASGTVQQSVNKSYGLSASSTKFVTELQELLDEQRVPPKKGNIVKSTARVLTNAESLALLIEKEKKKKEEEEQRAKKRRNMKKKKRREKEEEERRRLSSERRRRRKIKAKALETWEQDI